MTDSSAIPNNSLPSTSHASMSSAAASTNSRPGIVMILCNNIEFKSHFLFIHLFKFFRFVGAKYCSDCGDLVCVVVKQVHLVDPIVNHLKDLYTSGHVL